MNHYASNRDAKVTEEELTHIFRVDAFRVIIKVKAGYVISVECNCDAADSVVFEDVFGMSVERQGHCTHTASAVSYLHREASHDEYEIRRID